jgi:hypothetical protein
VKKIISAFDVETAAREDASRAFLLANALKPHGSESLEELWARAHDLGPTYESLPSPLATLTRQDPPRGLRYASLSWELTDIDLTEVTVWPGMSGLPQEWTDGSVVDVAARVIGEDLPNSAGRLAGLLRFVEQIETSDAVEWLTTLPLLIVPETLLHTRLLQPRQHWTLDDGCARSVALAILGVSSVRVYAGKAV